MVEEKADDDDEDPDEDKGVPVIVAVDQGASEEVKPR